MFDDDAHELIHSHYHVAHFVHGDDTYIFTVLELIIDVKGGNSPSPLRS